MAHKEDYNLWGTLCEIVYRNAAWILWILLGLVGMFSYDLLRHRKFSMSYVLGCTGIALFCGYVGGSYVLQYAPERASMYIPMLTLLSNNIISAFMSINWQALMQKDWKGAFEIIFRTKKE